MIASQILAIVIEHNYTWNESNFYCQYNYNTSLINLKDIQDIDGITNLLQSINIYNATFWVNGYYKNELCNTLSVPAEKYGLINCEAVHPFICECMLSMYIYSTFILFC